MRAISRSIYPIRCAFAAVLLMAFAGTGTADAIERDRLVDPIAACRSGEVSSGPSTAAMVRRKADGTLFVKNRSKSCIDQLVLGAGGRRYRIGRVTPEELVGDILDGTSLEGTSPIETIWRWTSDAFEHYCSQGSPFRAWWERSGSLLGRIYSNSFGCCSDVNHPILSSLLEIAGFPAWILYSPLHVAVQAGDLSTPTAYVDADHEVMIPGSLFTADHSAYPAYYFMDYLDYRDAYTDDQVAADPGLVLNRSGVVDPQPMSLALASGDRLWFTQEPAATIAVALPQISPDDVLALERTSDTKLGIADLDIRSFFQGIDESTPERCSEFEIAFPYAMIDSALVKVPRRATVHLVDELGAATPIEPAPVGEWVSRFAPAPTARTLATPTHDAWGNFRLKLRVCDVAARAMRPVRVRILFQYNDRIFPSDRANVTIERVSVPLAGPTS